MEGAIPRVSSINGCRAIEIDAMMATSSNTPANDDFHKLLLVVKDLAQQLDENRQATTKLKLHADLLKVPSTLVAGVACLVLC